MKTTYFSLRNASRFSLVGMVCLLLCACGSYQNSSYFENDGIYGYNGSETRNNSYVTNATPSGAAYQEYFRSLKENDNSSEIFTDVNSYSSKKYQNNADEAATYQSYGGWGSNPQQTNVYVYPNNNWGWNGGWGWNNGWNNWGWNSGWGWNNWGGNAGWNNGYYNNRDYARVNDRYYQGNSGYRRDYDYPNTTSRRDYGNTIGERTQPSFVSRRDYQNQDNGTYRRSYSQPNTSSYNRGGAYQNQSPSATSRRDYSQPNTDYRRQESAPARSYTPSYDNGGSSRSYSSPSSYGGGGGGGSYSRGGGGSRGGRG